MIHLIDKDALVAEIKRRKELVSDPILLGNDLMIGERNAYFNLLSFIDTLEVKEVDIDKEVDDVKKRFLGNITCREEQLKFAKHFFELGIKAQHDNWKVVNNINLPQADKNKIYCVLSKNKYLLARVIDHPQDDDLLQWKCTEFPFHRYDMCEGDKYMQIV